MRLLIVCDYSLAYLGGAQTALIRQAHALTAAGHEVTVLAPGASAAIGLQPRQAQPTANNATPIRRPRAVEPPPARTLPGLDLPLFRVSASLTRFVATLLDTAATPAAASPVAAHPFDAVLLHSEFGLAATVSAAARQRHIAVLHTVHTFFWRGPLLAAPLAPVVRSFHRLTTGLPAPRAKLASRPFDSALRGMTLALARTADLVLSPSAHQAARLRAAGLPKVAIVSNVTEPVPTVAAPPDNDTIRLAWIGRFAPEKRLSVALHGVAHARVTRPIELHVAGGTPTKQHRRAAQARAVWHGKLTEPQTAALIDHCHAVLLTSNGFDNQPMVALEAFSRGRPVILVDHLLATEFGAASLLCDTPDYLGVSRMIERVSSETELLTHAAAAAKQLSRRASSHTHSTRIEDLIKTVNRSLDASIPAP